MIGRMFRPGRLLASKSIRTQIIVGMLFFLFIVIVGIFFLTYHRSAGVISENMNNYVEQSLLQLDENITIALKSIDRTVNAALLEDDVMNALQWEKAGDVTSFKQKLQVNAVLERTMYAMEQPVSIRLFGMNGGIFNNVHSSYMPFHSIEEIQRYAKYGKVTAARGKFIWIGNLSPLGERQVSNESAVIGIRQILDLNDGMPLGYLLVSLHRWTVIQSMENVDLGRRGILLLVDDQNRIVNSSLPTSEWSAIQPKDLLEMKRLEGQPHSFAFADETYSVTAHSSPYTNWLFVSMIPESRMFSDLYAIRRISIAAGLFIIMTAVCYAFFLSSLLTKSFRELIQGMRSVEEGNLQVKLRIGGNEEVRHLGRAFNRMVSKLENLVERLAEQQIREKEARVQNLNSRFSPHFLYNTLNIVYWKCVKQGQEETAAMVVRLVKLLRYTVKPGNDLVAVREDFVQIEHYLDLQKERYGEQLTVDVQIDPAILACLIPHLLLQPLIENAIIHGLEPLIGEKRLQIRGWTESGEIRFSVQDNGPGMTEEQIQRIWREEKGAGIGLSNTDRRLKAHFGNLYGIAVHSAPDAGTTVTIRLPRLEETEHVRQNTYSG